MTLGPTWISEKMASTGPRARPRACRWTNLRLPGYEVRHCGHPTALRPYYVVLQGTIISDCFRLLDKAQAWAEAHAMETGRWVDARTLPPAPIPAGAMI